MQRPWLIFFCFTSPMVLWRNRAKDNCFTISQRRAYETFFLYQKQGIPDRMHPHGAPDHGLAAHGPGRPAAEELGIDPGAVTVTSADTLRLALAASGGAALRLRKLP